MGPIDAYPLPLDIFTTIFDILKEEEDDFKTLKSCALVQRDFTSHCQGHIFSTIKFDVRLGQLPAFDKLLQLNPALAHYVKKLDLVLHSESGSHALFAADNDLLPLTLDQLTHVQSLKLDGMGSILNWPSMNNMTRLALERMIQSPQITRLSFHYIKRMPIALTLQATNLRHLHFWWCEEADFSVKESDRVAKVPQLETLNVANAEHVRLLQSVLNLTMLSELTLCVYGDSQFEFTVAFLPTLLHLKSLDVKVDNHLKFLQALKSSFIKKLQTIYFTISVVDDEDPLSGLCEGLLLIHANNLLEDFTLDIRDIKEGPASQAMEHHWVVLDRILADQVHFSCLKNVCIFVETDAWEGGDSLQVGLEMRGEEYFQNMRQRFGPNFDFEVTCSW